MVCSLTKAAAAGWRTSSFAPNRDTLNGDFQVMAESSKKSVAAAAAAAEGHLSHTADLALKTEICKVWPVLRSQNTNRLRKSLRDTPPLVHQIGQPANLLI